MQLVPAPLIHQLLPQTLCIHLAATEERGDASCHGFWERGRTPIFDMRITDTDAQSYRKKEFVKVLEQHEKEKKDKYLQNCLEMWKDFMPMVYSVDGIAGREARNAEKCHRPWYWRDRYPDYGASS